MLLINVTKRSDQVRLNNALHSISAWCKTWGLKLNTSKTAAITFTNKKEPLDFAYITKTQRVNYLGVTLTSNLSWEPHRKRLQ